MDEVHPMQPLCELLLDQLTIAANSPIQFERTGIASETGDSIEFLDLKFTIDWVIEEFRQTLEISVYDKPTNLHIYTDPSTFYPFHYVYGWIQGENIRLIRNSSTEERYKYSLGEFKKFLLRRNYCDRLINNYIALNCFEDRYELLNGGKPHKSRKSLEEKDKSLDRYVSVRNSGMRPVTTKAVNIFNNLLQLPDANLVPVVMKGKSILTVMNKARNNAFK
jgi:succinate dehydrogenase flavin-adding protein (antitoxin of CptAB toxin-antitoxin module)